MNKKQNMSASHYLSPVFANNKSKIEEVCSEFSCQNIEAKMVSVPASCTIDVSTNTPNEIKQMLLTEECCGANMEKCTIKSAPEFSPIERMASGVRITEHGNSISAQLPFVTNVDSNNLRMEFTGNKFQACKFDSTYHKIGDGMNQYAQTNKTSFLTPIVCGEAQTNVVVPSKTTGVLSNVGTFTMNDAATDQNRASMGANTAGYFSKSLNLLQLNTLSSISNNQTTSAEDNQDGSTSGGSNGASNESSFEGFSESG